MQHYVGALMIDSHFMELQCSAQMSDVEAWLETLPMFVPTLWWSDPKIVYDVVGSEFGCGPCGSTECSAVCVSTDADSLWSLGKFECLIGMEGATEEVALQASLEGELCWPEECSAEFQAPIVGTGIPKCGRLMSSGRITADVWSELEAMEGLNPVAGNTLGGVKALAHQGASLEAEVRSGNVKAAGSALGGAVPEAAPEGGTASVEWGSVWDEVIHGISDGRKLDTEDAKRLLQLKEKAVRHATVWQTYIGKHMVSDKCFQQKYLRNTAPWVYTWLEAAELVGGKQEWPKDIARQWCQLNDQPLGGFIAAQTNDGDCYFRRGSPLTGSLNPGLNCPNRTAFKTR